MNNQIVQLENGDFEVLYSWGPTMDKKPIGDRERIDALEKRVDILVREIARIKSDKWGE